MSLFTSAFFIFTLLTTPGTDDIFVGSTPCGQMIRPMQHIAANADCALVRWELTLSKDPLTQQPTTYRLTTVSHHTNPDNTYSKQGNKNEITGKWSIVKGTGKNARFMIFQLDTGNTLLRFVKLSNDLIHLLDENDNYMTGDPFQSYTLYRNTK
jgi:hypothetical protein